MAINGVNSNSVYSTQFGQARKKAASGGGTPKFGCADGGIVSAPACAACCAAPLIVPALLAGLGIGIAKLIGLLKKRG